MNSSKKNSKLLISALKKARETIDIALQYLSNNESMENEERFDLEPLIIQRTTVSRKRLISESDSDNENSSSKPSNLVTCYSSKSRINEAINNKKINKTNNRAYLCLSNANSEDLHLQNDSIKVVLFEPGSFNGYSYGPSDSERFRLIDLPRVTFQARRLRENYCFLSVSEKERALEFGIFSISNATSSESASEVCNSSVWGRWFHGRFKDASKQTGIPPPKTVYTYTNRFEVIYDISELSKMFYEKVPGVFQYNIPGVWSLHAEVCFRRIPDGDLSVFSTSFQESLSNPLVNSFVNRITTSVSFLNHDLNSMRDFPKGDHIFYLPFQLIYFGETQGSEHRKHIFHMTVTAKFIPKDPTNETISFLVANIYSNPISVSVRWN